MADITSKTVFPVDSTWKYPGGSQPAPTTPYSGTFIPTLWSAKLTEKFYATTIFGEIANTDYQGEISNVGDKVIINTIPDLVVNDYKVGGNLDYQVPNPETIELVIDKGKYYAFQTNDVMNLQSKPNLMSMFTDDATMQMKQVIDKDVLFRMFFPDGDVSKIASSKNKKGAIWEKNMGKNAGAISGAYNMGSLETPVALTGANILQYLTGMSTVLDEANVPEDGRFLVISPYERWLLMQSPLAQAQFTGDPRSILRNGKIGVIDRFTVYVSNNLPRQTATTKWDGTEEDSTAMHIIFAGHKSALTFASQFTKTETLRNPQDFGDLVRGLNVYGSKIINGEGLVPMVVQG